MRRRVREPETTPEGWPIRETRFGRFYQVPGERCWRGVETLEEATRAALALRRRETRSAPVQARTDFNVWGDR